MIRSSLSCALGLLLAACSPQATADRSGHDHSHESGYHKTLRGDYTAGEPRWWKGNTHTHSWWSDGDSPPENAAAWYREHGYDFLVISDHNQMQAGALSRGGIVKYPSFWYTIDREDKQRALAVYRQVFSPEAGGGAATQVVLLGRLKGAEVVLESMPECVLQFTLLISTPLDEWQPLVLISLGSSLLAAAQRAAPRVLWKTTTRMRKGGPTKWLRTDSLARRVFPEIYDAAFHTRGVRVRAVFACVVPA